MSSTSKRSSLEHGLSRVSDWMDRYIWDGLVRGWELANSRNLDSDVDEHGINAGVDETTVARAGSDVCCPAALGTNPNLHGRRRRRDAGAAYSLRMVGLITALILLPLVGALRFLAAPSRLRGQAAECSRLRSGLI